MANKLIWDFMRHCTTMPHQNKMKWNKKPQSNHTSSMCGTQIHKRATLQPFHAVNERRIGFWLLSITVLTESLKLVLFISFIAVLIFKNTNSINIFIRAIITIHKKRQTLHGLSNLMPLLHLTIFRSFLFASISIAFGCIRWRKSLILLNSYS